MTSAQQLIQQTPGLTYRQLDCWTRKGYLPTQDNPRPGSGKPRNYTPQATHIAQAILRLTAAGLDLEPAARIAQTAAQPPGSDTPRSCRIAPGIWVVFRPELWTTHNRPRPHRPRGTRTGLPAPRSHSGAPAGVPGPLKAPEPSGAAGRTAR